VTVFRTSSARVGAAGWAAPQWGQKAKSPGLSRPQVAHVDTAASVDLVRANDNAATSVRRVARHSEGA
jgi:hypothetical protein